MAWVSIPEIPDEQKERWRAAADRIDRPLAWWIRDVLDKAASDVESPNRSDGGDS